MLYQQVRPTFFNSLSLLTSPNLMKYMLLKFRLMVECSRCLEWYHRMCERIPDSVLNDSDKIWYCQLCLQEQEKNPKMGEANDAQLIHNN